MASFHKVIGKQTLSFDWAELTDAVSASEKVLIDLGTGDGRFIIDAARSQPDWLCIGLDAAAENMDKNSRIASAKQKKGGLPNAVFIRAAAENLPGPFDAMADMVTINYPWGSLMRIVSEPDLENLVKIRRICNIGAELSILLNYSVFEDPDYLQRLGLSSLTPPEDNEALADVYLKAGFRIEKQELFAGEPPVRTRWGDRLVRGSNRKTLLIEAVAV